MIKKINQAIKKIVNLNSEDNTEKIKEIIEELKEKKEESEDNRIVNYILDFYMICNPLTELWENHEIASFSKKLAEINFDKDYVNQIIACFNGFSGITNYLLSIDDIFDNKNLLCIFKLILLIGNMNKLNEFIQNLKTSYTKEKDIQEIVLNFNIKNPLHISFIHELLKILFKERKERQQENNILSIIINNINQKEYLRCEICFDILYCFFRKEGNILYFICNNNHLKGLSATGKDFKKEIIIIQCNNCKTKCHIYETIFKCLSCKQFICKNCQNAHKTLCIESIFINLYEIGYVCEKHNHLYSDCCFFCYKNLCENCKSLHFHMSNPKIKQLLASNEDLLNNLNLKKDFTNKDYILFNYAKLYEFMKSNNLINFKVFNSINFLNGHQRSNFPTDFFAEEFYNKDFKIYYKKLITEAFNGKANSIEVFKKIYDEYKSAGINISKDFNYDDFINKCNDGIKNRDKNLNDFVEVFEYFLLKLTNIYIKMENGKKELEEKLKQINIQNDIIFLKIKIIALYNNNRISEVYLRNLINRHLSDFLIRELINRYPEYFCEVELSLNNFYDIFNFYRKKKINIKNDKKIISFIEKLKTMLEKKRDITEINNNFENNNDIIFIKDIIIDQKTIKKEEMNFILELLFYIKKIGNVVAHPSIDISKANFIKNIDKSILHSNEISNNISKAQDDGGLESNDDKKKIRLKLLKIIEEILIDFNEVSYEKEIDIHDLLNFMFRNISDKLINDRIFLLRILKNDLIDIINGEICFQFKEFDIYKDVINQFENEINNLKLKLKNIELFLNDDLKKINLDINLSINDLKNFEMYTIKNIIQLSSEKFKSKFSQREINSYILYILGKEFLKMEKDFNSQKKKLINKIEELTENEIVKNKLEKIYSLIDDFFNKKVYYIKPKKLIEEVQENIKQTKKNTSLFSFNIDLEKIYQNIELLLGNSKVNWLNLPYYRDISVEGYLYYKQNKSK